MKNNSLRMPCTSCIKSRLMYDVWYTSFMNASFQVYWTVYRPTPYAVDSDVLTTPSYGCDEYRVTFRPNPNSYFEYTALVNSKYLLLGQISQNTQNMPPMNDWVENYLPHKLIAYTCSYCSSSMISQSTEYHITGIRPNTCRLNTWRNSKFKASSRFLPTNYYLDSLIYTCRWFC